MRTILSTFLLLSFYVINAQVPQSFNYQAIVRDAQDNVISNQNVSIQLSILPGSADGIPIFRENHFPTTNQFGLINITIGRGSNVFGDISMIDWGANTYYLQVAIDESGGTNFIVMGIANPYF